MHKYVLKFFRNTLGTHIHNTNGRIIRTTTSKVLSHWSTAQKELHQSSINEIENRYESIWLLFRHQNVYFFKNRLINSSEFISHYVHQIHKIQQQKSVLYKY